jgi:hypothetical protein
MENDTRGNNQPEASALHPLIYLAMIGLTCWFVAAAWGFFDYSYAGLTLAVVTGFFLMAVLLPSILAHIWRKYVSSEADQVEARTPLREWMTTNFQTWQGRLKGSDAAIMVLLPFAAAALGLTAIMIVLHVVEHNLHA